VSLGGVVEGHDAPAEADEQVGAEGDEGPEGQDGDDLGLDDGGQGDQVEVEGEVGLFVFGSVCGQQHVPRLWPVCGCSWVMSVAATVWARRTELTRRAMEMVCWARVILFGRVWWFVEGIIGRMGG
jgi:hypothetical protein